MKYYIILFALFFSIDTLQAQSNNATTQDSTQENNAAQENNATQENTATQQNTATQDSTQENAATPETSDAEITDEELEKFAVTIDSVNDMQESLTKEVTELVKSNEKLTVARYNELYKIIGDDAQLATAKATPEEIAFVKEVMAKQEEGTEKIKETFQSLAKEYVGATSFNKIKKALASDSELQKRYQSFMDKLQQDSSGGGN